MIDRSVFLFAVATETELYVTRLLNLLEERGDCILMAPEAGLDQA